MVSAIFSSLAHSSLSCLSDSPNRTPFLKQNQLILLSGQKLSLPSFGHNSRLSLIAKRRQAPVCFFNGGKDSKSSLDGPGSGLDWPILKRWDVPWQWQTVSLTSLACGLSFVLTGLVEVAALPYLGLKIEELSLDEKAEILFLDQGITTAVVIGILFGIANTFGPLPEDVFRYDVREPFDLRKGWLLWAAVGLVGALFAIALTGVLMSTFNGETPQRETDALVQLLPLIGFSSVRDQRTVFLARMFTACLIGITSVLAPILEETVFRGFFLVALTQWVSTPVAVLASAAVFGSSSNSWRVSSAVYIRRCSRIITCSNTQPYDPNYNSCLLELGGNRDPHFASVARI